MSELDYITIRKLSKCDYENGYINLLSELTTVGNVTETMFNDFITNLPSNHYIYVMQDNRTNSIIGSGSLLIENKVIHSCGNVGHIEDVVISSEMRGLGLGKILVNKLIEIAKSQRCYKVILDCNQSNIAFYEKCGFIKKETQMAQYF